MATILVQSAAPVQSTSSLMSADSLQTCKYCNVRPVYPTYEYCSRRCGQADKAKLPLTAEAPSSSIQTPYDVFSKRPSRSSWWTIGRRTATLPSKRPLLSLQGDSELSPTSSQGDSISATSSYPVDWTLCMNCQQRPKFNGYEFCSRQCLDDLAFALGRTSGSVNKLHKATLGPALASVVAPVESIPCGIASCTRSVPFSDLKYCGDQCAKDAVTSGLEPACLMCRTFPKVASRYAHFCSVGCAIAAQNKAPLLLELPESDPKYDTIVNQFKAGGAVQSIHKIYKVVNTRKAEDTYQKYKRKIESKHEFVKQGKPAGNENRRWHGTARNCKIGDTPESPTLCTSRHCKVCNIMRTSFKVSKARNGSYGKGIYTSAISTKSQGYNYGSRNADGFSALFLTRVVVGREYTWGVSGNLTSRSRRSAPLGYNSVASDPRQTELIVYRSEAIIPSWLIIYRG